MFTHKSIRVAFTVATSGIVGIAWALTAPLPHSRAEQPPATSAVRGDLNRDGQANLEDIEPFVLALTDRKAWIARFDANTATLVALADFNNDGQISEADIPGFGDAAGAPWIRLHDLLPDERAQSNRSVACASCYNASGTGVCAAPTARTCTVPQSRLGQTDLHIDSDNNNDLNNPDRSSTEDSIEDDATKPGKVLKFEQRGTRIPVLLEIYPQADASYGSSRLWALEFPTTRVSVWRYPTGTLPANQVLNYSGGSPTYSHPFWYQGDMNGDGAVSSSDISPLVLAISNSAEFCRQYPCVPYPLAGDFDGNGALSVGDIGGFTARMSETPTAVPAPVFLWVESNGSLSSSLGDIRLVARADADSDGALEILAAEEDAARATADVELGMPRDWGAAVQANEFSTVNLHSGNVLTSIPLTSIDPLGPPISFVLYHNSLTSPSVPSYTPFSDLNFGPYWRASYGGYVQGNDGDLTVSVVNDDGRRDAYRRNPNPHTSPLYRFYDPPAGVFNDLRWNSTANRWILTAPNQWKVEYLASGVSGRYRVARVVDSSTLSEDSPANAAVVSLDDPDAGGLDMVRAANNYIPLMGFGSHTFFELGTDFVTGESLVNDRSRRFRWKWDAATRRLTINPPWGGVADGPPGHDIIIDHDTSGRITQLADIDGLTWTYQYADSLGRVTRIADPLPTPADGAKTFDQDFSYDPPAALVWVTNYTDRRDYTWKYRFDVAGNLVRLTTPDVTPNERIYTFDAQHNPLTSRNELNHIWSFSYGPIGNLLTTTSPLTGAAAQTWTYTWTAPAGPAQLWNFYRVNRVDDPKSRYILYEYNAAVDPTMLNRVREMPAATGGAEGVTQLDYYTVNTTLTACKGQLQWVTDANNGRHEFTYDARGFQNGELGGMEVGGTRLPSDYLPHVQGTNDGLGRPESGTNGGGGESDEHNTPDGCVIKVFCEYEQQGRASVMPTRLGKYPAGQPFMRFVRPCMCRGNGFDDNRRPTLIQADYQRDPEFSPEHAEDLHRLDTTLNYTANGEPLRRLQWMSSTYSAHSSGWSFARRFDLVYNSTIAIPTSPKEVAPTGLDGPDGGRLRYLRTDGKAGFDALGRPKSIMRGTTTETHFFVTYTYDAAGRLTREDNGNGTAVIRVYDAADRLTSIEHRGSVNNLLLRITYVWDKDNTITQRIEEDFTVAPAVMATVTFAYDNRLRLTHEDRVETAGGMPATIYNINYTYDQLGNRLTKTDSVVNQRVDYYYDVDDDRTVPGDPRFTRCLDAWDIGMDSANQETADNRLLSYVERVNNQVTRKVWYQYYRPGWVANITVKDYDPACPRDGAGCPTAGCSEGTDYRRYRNLALYYTTSGQLWRAFTDSWTVTTGGVALYDGPTVFPVQTPREFYYNGAGGRFLTRDVVVAFNSQTQRYQFQPPGGSGPTETDHWSDTLGLLPWGDYDVRLTDSADPDQFRDTATPLGRWAMWAADGVSGRQPINTAGQPTPGAQEYFHADLVGSNMLRTDAAGVELDVPGAPPLASAQVSYTAFGEPIYETTGGLEVGGQLPAGQPRHSYVGAYGYEADGLVLAGAPGTAPITLSHVGARWYDPALGRFVQRDPMGVASGANSYRYASNNPLGTIDPTGLINDNGDYQPPDLGEFWELLRRLMEGGTHDDSYSDQADLLRDLWGDEYLVDASDNELLKNGICSGALVGTSGYLLRCTFHLSKAKPPLLPRSALRHAPAPRPPFHRPRPPRNAEPWW